MNNIISYVNEYGRACIDEKLPFCEVDSLVLSQLSYLKYDCFVPGPRQELLDVRLIDILRADKNDMLFDNVRDRESNLELLCAAATSERYKNLRLNYYVNDSDSVEEKQFSAVTFFLNDIVYVAYRGTDATFVGWKEDLNMAFMPVIPAQEEGAKYLDFVAKKVNRDIMLGGHSKGGNIAVYSAVVADERIRRRIKSIYNHDAPGFTEETFLSQNYLNIKDRIHKTVPQASIIGMLMQQHEDYTIVKSNRVGLMQHDPFSWEINGGDFVRMSNLTKSAKYMNKTLNGWLASMDIDTRKKFCDTLHSVVCAMNISTFEELKQSWYRSTIVALRATKAMDEQSKKAIFDTLALLFKEGKENLELRALLADKWRSSRSITRENM